MTPKSILFIYEQACSVCHVNKKIKVQSTGATQKIITNAHTHKKISKIKFYLDKTSISKVS